MIEAQNIVKAFGEVSVLKNVNLHVPKGKIASIVGPSGSGKTTLLQILGTLDQADSGKVIIGDTDVTFLKGVALSKVRNKKIGFIFQFHHLLSEFNAIENAMIPSLINSGDKSKAEAKAKELLQYLGLGHRLDHKPSQLSGGEQQRVAIARALINQPDIVFADEPTGNLDSGTSEEIHELFLQLQKDFDQTFVIVTHNDALAKLSDINFTLRDGIIHTTDSNIIDINSKS